MKNFDIIIVGAGPAGLKCAETLSKSEYNVLILEKKSIIGPKVCAGGLTQKSINYLKLPNELINFKSNEIKIHLKNYCHTIKHKNNLISTINRKELGQWQLNKIKNIKNITIKTNSKVSKITKDYIFVNDEKIYYKFLVGADGSTSIVRKYLIKEPIKINTAMQYLISNSKSQNIEFFLDNNFFTSCYSWIFPNKNFVSVGCGGNPKLISAGKLKNNFNKFLKEKNIDVSNAEFQTFPISYDYNGYKFNNIFLIGDAAGLASGFSGEGIYQALVSGEEIAKEIINPKYKSKEIIKLLKNKKKQELLLKILNKSGKLRNFIFYIGLILLRIPYIRKKTIKVFW